MLAHQYELFKILSNESITSMFTRMTSITNSLDALGRTYTNVDIVSKILRFLPKSWEAKVMTIHEAKDLTKISLEELIGSLMTHEITMEKQELEEKPKKNLAFKIIHHIDDDVKDDIALITRQFQNLLVKKHKNKKFLNFKKDGNKEESS
jgi:hypothetical protein